VFWLQEIADPAQPAKVAALERGEAGKARADAVLQLGIDHFDRAVVGIDLVIDGRRLEPEEVEHGRILHQYVDGIEHPLLGLQEEVELRRGQPQVEGVEDRPHRRDGQIGLEVLLVVPTEGADAVAPPHPHAAEHIGQPAGTGVDVGVGGMARRCPLPGDHLAVAEQLGPALHQRGDRQGDGLHGALHHCRAP